MTTQNVTKSLIIASTLVLSNKKYDKNLSLDLHYAIEKNDCFSAQKLIKNPQVDVNAKVDYGTKLSAKGCTPLILCSARGDRSLEIAKALLAHKEINVNLQNNQGTRPLIMCSWKGDEALQIAKVLLGHKDINVNLQNNDGWTSLIMCSWKGDESLQIAKALLKHESINVNLQKSNGYTPLDIIIYWIKKNKENYQYVDLWNVLVAKGAVLGKQKKDYQKLNPSKFKEPEKSYIQSIKNTPPINLASLNMATQAA